jgi:hypothetical protein
MARKRKQGLVKQFYAGKMTIVDGKVQVSAEKVLKVLSDGSKIEKELTVVPMAENRLFRKFGGNTVIGEGGHMDWTNFAVVSAGDKGVQPLIPEFIFDDGFYHEGKLYKAIMRSASGMRLAKAVFTSVPELWESLDEVTYGAQFGDVVEMSKRRTREGLALTSTLEIADMKFSFNIIDDFDRTVEIDSRQFIDGRMQDVKVEVALTPTDGQGYITYEKAVEIARDLGLSYVPSAFQVRFAGAKGLLIVYKWNRKAKKEWDADVLFHDSMWKYDFDTARFNEENGNAPRLEIAAYTKPLKSQYVGMSYQFVQALDITPEDLISLAKEALDGVENGIMVDASKAMAFLGMIDGIGEGGYDEVLISRLTKTLDANPDMIKDFYVQRKLRGMVEKFVLDMRKGRVPVQGGYRYIIADPTVVFGNSKGMLKAGEAYYNGRVATIAGFRSPLIHSSEVVKLNLVSVKKWEKMTEYSEEFGKFTYLNELIVLNTYDDSLPRMGGADVDGDKIMMSEDVRLINSVKGGKVVFDQGGAPAKKVPNTREEVIKFDLSTMKKSRIGIMTDYATVWTDYMIHKKNPKADENVQVLRILQGQEIDSVKTGYVPPLPDSLKTTFAPHWMEKNLGKPEDKHILEYKSTSPLGQLYDFIMEFWAEFSQVNPEDCEKRNLAILRGIDKAEASAIYKYVARLEESYRQELKALMEYAEENGLDDDSDQLNAIREEIFDRYTRLIQDIDADPRTVAGVAYQVAYHREGTGSKRSVSFPWITAFDGLITVLSQIADERFKLVPVRGRELTAGTMKFSGKESKDADGKVVARAQVPNGTFEVVEIEGRFFAKVKRTAKPVTEKKTASAEKLVHFQIRGFKYHETKTARKAFESIKKNGGIVELVQKGEYITVNVNNTQIGVVGGDDDFTMITVMNKKLQIASHGDLTFVSKKDGKTYDLGGVNVTARVLEQLEAPEAIVTDLKGDFDEKFQAWGFAATPVVSFDIEANVGTVKCEFKGKEVVLNVSLDPMENLYFSKRVQNPEIQEAITRLVAKTITALRTA